MCSFLDSTGINILPIFFHLLPTLLFFWIMFFFFLNIVYSIVLQLQRSESAVVAQWQSHVWLFATLWTTASQASLSFIISRNLLKLMSMVMSSNNLVLYCPLLLLPSIFHSIRGFFNESALCIMWPKYWSFSFSISPSNEYLGLLSFKMDWLDLLVVQGVLKSLLQQQFKSINSLVLSFL